ncbi:putative kinetochore protein spc24 [Psilocybe cubensis]|uniref:Kinetochore protein Spc24 n=2 Tax=Psilocybe cubensis TaxID=181762 RepID=A0A8H8CN35_PSICU|nr:putative kinetochore protein spc24 [Psilocybe cubensis]KAH9484041.1 putative kinetochore protein spc24 [Psilocybe cubensis]
MIDVQDATKLIRDMLPIIDPDEDYLTIVAAEEQISASEARRKKEFEEALTNLKALSKVLEAARISSTRPGSVPSEQAHATTLNELDGTKISLAKAISDAETALGSKEAELSALKEDARKLEVYDPAAEHEKELDGSTLRLAIYKAIGFEPILDKNGNIKKMLVTARSGDVHSVDFNTEKSDLECTELLWKLVNS